MNDVYEPRSGYTKIMNEMIETLSRAHLSTAETRCLFHIVRRTLAWQKTSDFIALTQFANATGLARQNAHRALRSLSARKIVVIAGDDRKRQSYAINLSFEHWQLSSKTMTVEKRKNVTNCTVIATDDTLSSALMTDRAQSVIATDELKRQSLKKSNKENDAAPARRQNFEHSLFERKTEEQQHNECAKESRRKLEEHKRELRARGEM